jgi:hypothetical protein
MLTALGMFVFCILFIPHAVWMIREGNAALETGIISESSHPYLLGRAPRDRTVSAATAGHFIVFGYIGLGVGILSVVILPCMIFAELFRAT